MKKLLFLILALALIFPATVFAVAGSCTQTPGAVRNDVNNIQAKTITFVCTGDSGDGSIPDIDTTAANTKFIKGWYFYDIEAYPTAGGTAPDAADVMIWNEAGIDMLGAEQLATGAAYAGLNLIQPISPRSTIPNKYLPRGGLHANNYPIVKGVWTLDVNNQSTASADYTIVWTFVR